MFKENRFFASKIVGPVREYLERRKEKKVVAKEKADLALLTKKRQEEKLRKVDAMFSRVADRESRGRRQLIQPKLFDKFVVSETERGPIAALKNTFNIHHDKVTAQYEFLLKKAKFEEKQLIVRDRTLTPEQKDIRISELYSSNRILLLSEEDAYAFNKLIEKSNELYETVEYATGVLQVLDSITLTDAAQISVEGAKSVINSLLQLKDVNRTQVFALIRVVLLGLFISAPPILSVACDEASPTTTAEVTPDDESNEVQPAEQTETQVNTDETEEDAPAPIAAPAAETVEAPVDANPNAIVVAESLGITVTPETSEMDLNRILLEATIEAARDAGLPPELTPTSIEIHPGEVEGTIEIEGYTEQNGKKILVIEKVFNNDQSVGPTQWRIVDLDSAAAPIVDDEFFDYESGEPLPEMTNANTQLFYEGGREGYLLVTVTNEDGSTSEVKIQVKIPEGTTLYDLDGNEVNLDSLSAKTVSQLGTTQRTHVEFLSGTEAVGFFSLESGVFTPRIELVWTNGNEAINPTDVPAGTWIGSDLGYEGKRDVPAGEEHLWNVDARWSTKITDIYYENIIPAKSDTSSGLTITVQGEYAKVLWINASDGTNSMKISVAGDSDWQELVYGPNGWNAPSNPQQIVITGPDSPDWQFLIDRETNYTNQQILDALVQAANNGFVEITLKDWVDPPAGTADIWEYSYIPDQRARWLNDQPMPNGTSTFSALRSFINNLISGTPNEQQDIRTGFYQLRIFIGDNTSEVN